MTTIKVNAGICGFVSRVQVNPLGKFNYELKIETECPHIQDLNKDLPTFDFMEELSNLYGVKIKEATLKHIRTSCVGCLVIPAIFKAAQADAKLALPKDGDFQFE